jgi:hypothetical protein
MNGVESRSRYNYIWSNSGEIISDEISYLEQCFIIMSQAKEWKSIPDLCAALLVSQSISPFYLICGRKMRKKRAQNDVVIVIVWSLKYYSNFVYPNDITILNQPVLSFCIFYADGARYRLTKNKNYRYSRENERALSEVEPRSGVHCCRKGCKSNAGNKIYKNPDVVASGHFGATYYIKYVHEDQCYAWSDEEVNELILS